MKNALYTFWNNEKSVTQYLFDMILGVWEWDWSMKIKLPMYYSAHNLPDLNYY